MPWLTGDNEWMKKRLEEWKLKELYVREYCETKTALKHLREYYLTGNVISKASVSLIFRLAYHPDGNEELWRKLCDEYSINHFNKARHMVLNAQHLFDRVAGRLFQFLNGKVYREGTFEFQGETMRYSHWSPLGFHKYWSAYSSVFLTSPIPQNYSICHDILDFWFSCLAHIPEECFSLDDGGRDKSVRTSLEDVVLGIKSLFYYIAFFVEPRGLKGDDSPAFRFAQEMRAALDTRDIPVKLKYIWEYTKTCEEYRHLHVVKARNYSGNYWSVVWHSDKPIENLLKVVDNIYHCFYGLGFCDEPFDSTAIEQVELKKHLSAKFIKIIGYEKTESIPAYRYRIKTTERYVNNTKDRIDFDVIIFSHPKRYEWKESTPVVMLVPRPEQDYDLGGMGYFYIPKIIHLNYRLIRRTLSAKYGYVFYRYENYGCKKTEKKLEKYDPFFDVSYSPLKINDSSLLDTAKHDFPILKDSPLPPLA